MPSSSDCWGIEVGASGIKAVRLQRSGKGGVTLAEHDVIPFKKVLTTPDLDVDETIRLGLDQFLARHQIGKSTVVASVPGHMAFARFAKLPPVDPKQVGGIVRYEAQQQIPFPFEQVEWDYQTFEHPDSPEVEVGIFAITKDRVQNWLSNFNAVNLPVHGLALAPLGVYNAMAYDLDIGEDSPGTILLDIGTQATELIVVEGDKLWLRTIPIGGHHFTEALVRSFKLSYSKAEKIKQEAGTSKYARQIFQAMRPVFVDLVGEVQKSLGYYQSMTRDAELTRLIGLGSTFRLPGLQKFLKQQLQIDVKRLDGFQKLTAEGDSTFSDQALSMASAYGLALQGLDKESVSCNLLPTQIVRQQVWRAKTPWNVAAALLIAASAVLAYTRLTLDRAAYRANEPVRQQIQSVISQAESFKSEWDSVERESDPRQKIENLRQTLRYRDLWPSMLNDIQNALASTEPQEALLNGNLQAIKEIPRNERRQIFLEEITHEYRAGAAEAPENPIWGQQGYIQVESTSQGGSGSGSMGGYGPGSGGSMGMGSAGSMGGGSMGRGSTQQTDRELPPSFVITVKGTTPRKQAAEFLNDTFLAYLQDQAEQDSGSTNQLYRIKEVDLRDVMPAMEVAQSQQQGQYGSGSGSMGRGSMGRGSGSGSMGSGSMGSGSGSMGPGRMGPGSGSGSMMRGSGSMGRGSGMMGPGSGMGGLGGGEAEINVDVTHLRPMMPDHPLAEEDRSSDWQFVIGWRVEIVRPGESSEQSEEDGADDGSASTVADAETSR